MEEKQTYLEEIEPMLKQIQEITDRHKDNGEEGLAIIVAATEKDAHSGLICGKGGDIVHALAEFITDDKRYENLFLLAMKSILAYRILND